MPPVVVLTGMAFEARLARGPGVEVIYRDGRGRLDEVLAARLRQPCAGVISFGVAGGLDPSLKPGTVVIADRVMDGERRHDCDRTWAAALRTALPGAIGGLLAAADNAVVSVADKLALHHGSGALLIDMESHFAARLASSAQLPFAVCRVVLDDAGRAVPPAALAAMGEDGGTDIGALLASLLRHPGQLPALLRLAGDAGAARAALRSARAAAGPRFSF
jgi:hopanoid-associated phosphorylase